MRPQGWTRAIELRLDADTLLPGLSEPSELRRGGVDGRIELRVVPALAQARRHVLRWDCRARQGRPCAARRLIFLPSDDGLCRAAAGGARADRLGGEQQQQQYG